MDPEMPMRIPNDYLGDPSAFVFRSRLGLSLSDWYDYECENDYYESQYDSDCDYEPEPVPVWPTASDVIFDSVSSDWRWAPVWAPVQLARTTVDFYHRDGGVLAVSVAQRRLEVYPAWSVNSNPFSGADIGVWAAGKLLSMFPEALSWCRVPT